MPVIRNLKVIEANLVEKTITGDKIADETITGGKLVDRTITGGKVALDTLTGNEIGADAIGSSELAPSAVFWSHVKGTVIKYASIGTVETAIDTGLPSVSAFFITLWDARGVAKTKDPVGGTVYLIADTAGSIDLYAIA